MTPFDIMQASINLALVMVGIAISIGFVRLAKGPSLADRVVALDMMTTAVIGVCGLYAVRTESEAFLDIAVALALVSFLSVVALARYAERLGRRSDSDD
jgi:multicomponent Na+:H+ antiporter subunit F